MRAYSAPISKQAPRRTWLKPPSSRDNSRKQNTTTVYDNLSSPSPKAPPVENPGEGVMSRMWASISNPVKEVARDIQTVREHGKSEKDADGKPKTVYDVIVQEQKGKEAEAAKDRLASKTEWGVGGFRDYVVDGVVSLIPGAGFIPGLSSLAKKGAQFLLPVDLNGDGQSS